MKGSKLLLLLFLFITISCFSQNLRDSVIVDNGLFKVLYSETLEEPLRVEYKVLCPDGSASRSGMYFYTVPGIKTSDDKDYFDNEWDKGHMAPAASFSCSKEMMYKTFTYVNSALQNQNLNRGVWKYLEIYERELAKKYTVNVVIIMEFKGVLNRVPSGAAIPTGFFKMISYNNIKECFFFQNYIPRYSSFKEYKCDCKNIK